MKSYLVFLKKEIIESIRTKKLFIILGVFIFIGVLSPLIAKITPDIIKKLIPGGEQINLPEASLIDSLEQFFKNVKQIGLTVFLITFSGILTKEISKGSLINLLTKGMSRKSIILSKYSLMGLIWSLGIAFSFGITYFYNINLFPKLKINNLAFSIFCIWLFGMYLLSMLILFSVITSSSYTSLLIVGAVLLIGLVLNIFEKVEIFNPVSLSTKNIELLKGIMEASNIYPAIGVSTLCIFAFLLLSMFLFNKKEIS